VFVGLLYYTAVIWHPPIPKKARVQSDISTLEQAVYHYKDMYSRYPVVLGELVDAEILQEIKLDPWGNEYQYKVESESYDIYSLGGPIGQEIE